MTRTHPLQLREAAATGRQVRAFPLALSLKGEDDGTFEGYGSMFGVRDAYDDIIVKGAFTKTLATHKAAGTMPAMLWQHDAREPIGVWLDMVEDEKGLKVRGQLAPTARGMEARALLKMGALNGLSIGFIATGADWDRDNSIRLITEVELWELSLVTFPANEAARVTSVKAGDVAGITTIRQAEQLLRRAGFSDDGAKALIALVRSMPTTDPRDADVGALAERDAQGVARAAAAVDRLQALLSTTTH